MFNYYLINIVFVISQLLNLNYLITIITLQHVVPAPLDLPAPPQVHPTDPRDAKARTQARLRQQEHPDHPRQQDLLDDHQIPQGHRTSPLIQKSLKKESSTYYSRRNDTHPFDKMEDIEHYCKTTDSSLFLFGSNSKKRPNNIVFGRLYEFSLLDMVEFGIEKIEGIEEFETLLKVPTHTRPVIIFQGDSWETDSALSKVRNLLHDFFVENVKVKELEINNAMRLTITFSAYENKVAMRVFEVLMNGNILEDDGKTSIEEVGPKVDLVLRRTRFSDDELWKQATKVLKVGGKKEDKNIMRDNMGHKRGKLFVDKQNLDTLGLRKTKALVNKEKFESRAKEMRSLQGGAEEFEA